VVTSAADADHRNRRVSFKSDVQESLKLLDTKPSFVWKDSHHKHKPTKTNNDVSNRTRSKADYTDLHIGSRTRSKMHNVNVNNLSVQNLFFPLHDAILFHGYGKCKSQDLQLGVVDLSNPKPIISFARNNNLLDKMPFCHLTQYCYSNTAVDFARILKLSTSPAGIKYKFGIQVLKGIKNVIDLDKKNRNQL
jgi:hypothetical protein